MALKLSVIGTGYLGATHAACMASLGFEVIGFDTENIKIDLLSKGKVPFYEPDLEELLAEQIKAGRLRFTKDIAELADVDVHVHVDANWVCLLFDQVPQQSRTTRKQRYPAHDTHGYASVCQDCATYARTI